MKSVVFGMLLLSVGAVGGASLYQNLRNVPSAEEAQLEWLGLYLDLNTAQSDRVEALHRRFEPKICRMGAAFDKGDKGAGASCRILTRELIDAVSLELNAAQLTRYHELVARCLDGGCGIGEKCEATGCQ